MKLSDIFGTGCTFWAYARFLHRPGPLRATSLFFRLSIKTELTENVDRFHNLRESPIFKWHSHSQGKMKVPTKGWRLSKKRKKSSRFSDTPSELLKRLGLVQVILWDGFAVVVVQLNSTIIAIFGTFMQRLLPLRIIVDYCRPQKRPML